MPVKGRVNSVSAHENGSGTSIGKVTRKGLRRHFDEISKAAFVQLLIRAAVAASVFFLPQGFNRLLSIEAVNSALKLSADTAEKISTIGAAAVSAALYIFLLIPMRFWARQKVRRVYYRHTDKDKKQSKAYSRWLRTGLLRYLRGILWGLPFIACVVYFTVLRTILDAPTFNAPIHWLALLLAGNPENGVGNVSLAWGLIGGLILLFGLLFAYGWWRDLPFEYLPVRSIGTSKTLHWSRHILKRHRREMLGNTCVNFLLSLPAILGFGTVLGMYAMDRVNFSLSVDMVLAQMRNLVTQPVPRLVLLELLAVFAVLYLPLCIWRKCRNAALMARCMRSRHSHSHENDLTKEEEKPAAAPAEPKQEEPAEIKAETDKGEHAAG